jgi:hypothetical protein
MRNNLSGGDDKRTHRAIGSLDESLLAWVFHQQWPGREIFE